jgi:2-dehydropantoate 2-reductase
MKKMKKILVFGAGVLGSLYAARLKQSGNDVTILARGKRFKEISENGIELEDALCAKKDNVQLTVVSELKPEDVYDWIVVLVRKNQVADVLPVLSSNQKTSNILFMVNNSSGYDEWISAVGPKRLTIGFAGAGGQKNGSVVRYKIVLGFLQPTTFGELDGSKTSRLRELVDIFKSAGFPTDVSSNMDAWQKSHVAWVSPLSNAIYKMNGDNLKLARSTETLRLFIKAVKEGFQCLRLVGLPIEPWKISMIEWIPEFLLIVFLKILIQTNYFKTLIVEHAMIASDEMWQIADEFRIFIEAHSFKTPAIDELRSYIPSTVGERGRL